MFHSPLPPAHLPFLAEGEPHRSLGIGRTERGRVEGKEPRQHGGRTTRQAPFRTWLGPPPSRLPSPRALLREMDRSWRDRNSTMRGGPVYPVFVRQSRENARRSSCVPGRGGHGADLRPIRSRAMVAQAGRPGLGGGHTPRRPDRPRSMRCDAVVARPGWGSRGEPCPAPGLRCALPWAIMARPVRGGEMFVSCATIARTCWARGRGETSVTGTERKRSSGPRWAAFRRLFIGPYRSPFPPPIPGVGRRSRDHSRESGYRHIPATGFR